MSKKNYKGVSLEDLYFLGKFLIDGNRDSFSHNVRRNIPQGLIFIRMASDGGCLEAKEYLDDIENKANRNNVSVKRYLSNQGFIERKEKDKLAIDRRLIDIAYDHIIYCYENNITEIEKRFFNKIGEGTGHIRNFNEENPISRKDFIYRQKKMSIYGFMVENDIALFNMYDDWSIERCFTEGSEEISFLRNKYLESLRENHESIVSFNGDVSEENEENNNTQEENLNDLSETNRKDDSTENNNEQKENLDLSEKNEENNTIKKEEILIRKLSNIENFDLIKQIEEAKQSINNTYNYIYKFCDNSFENVDPLAFPESVEYYKNLARCGDIKACVIYAFMLYYGVKTNVNMDESNKFFKMAADFEDPLALFCYTDFLKNEKPSEIAEYLHKSANLGLNIAKDCFFVFVVNHKLIDLYSEAEKLFLEAVKQNNSEAIFSYANFLIKGKFFKTEDIKQDIKKGLEYLKILADNGSVKSMYLYAKYTHKYNKENTEEIYKYYRKAIEGGNTDAMRQFGIMILDNMESESDDNIQEAIKLIKRAADNGDFVSAGLFAEFLQEGFHIEKDLQEATRYFKMAASSDINNPLENSVPAAYEYVNLIYFEESIKEKNAKEAIEYLEGIINLNLNGIRDKKIIDTVLRSKNRLGVIYYIEKDFKNMQKSFKLLKKTENYGNLFANYILYTMYKNGEGTNKNPKKAKKIFSNIINTQDSDALFRLYKKIKEYASSIKIDDSDLAIIVKKAAQDISCIKAKIEYANMLRYGIGVKKDVKTALVEFKKLVDDCNRAEVKIEFLKKCVKSDEKTILIKLGELDNYVEALINYADMLKCGEGTNVNLKEAENCYAKAINFNRLEAVYPYAEVVGISKLIFKERENLELNDNIVNIYNEISDPSKKEKIVELIASLARIHEVNSNSKTAIKCYKTLLKFGIKRYSNDIGVIYYNSEDKKDKAEKYFKIATEDKSDCDFVWNYANLLYYQKKDMIATLFYLTKYKNLSKNLNKKINDSFNGMYNLIISKNIDYNREEVELSLNGFINEDEKNIKYIYKCGSDLLKKGKQENMAIIFLETAANKGNSDAMYALSTFYDLTGKKEDGARYLDMAAKHGNEKAIKKLEINRQKAAEEIDNIETKKGTTVHSSLDNK